MVTFDTSQLVTSPLKEEACLNVLNIFDAKETFQPFKVSLKVALLWRTVPKFETADTGDEDSNEQLLSG